MKLWLYRPFPYKAVSRALEGAKRVVVLARSSVFGSFSPLGADVSSAINLSSGDQKVFDVVLGVGGVDVKSSDIVSIYRMVASGGERTFWWVR
jgi:pyruvate/2-oxoacid:ferredoxin oxidoreductase alpha subunit